MNKTKYLGIEMCFNGKGKIKLIQSQTKQDK